MRRTPPILLLLGVLAPWPAHGQPPGVRSGTSTPPRLATVDGTASFRRPGGADWTSARVNTPLGAGDALSTERDTSVEIQIGAASYLRLGATTYLELSDVSAEQLQLKLASGEASLDLREVTPRLLEVDTPQAAFTIDRPGYYRLHVDERSGTLIVRRGGGAMMTPGNAPAAPVRTGEEAVVASDGVHHYAAPDLDAWDRWCAARTDRLLDPLSARYVADGIYGVADLDHTGTWRRVDEFGPVWLPDAVPPGWVPFVAGQWIYDTTFGWTWIDDMPWGWAPFHHGRWVSVDGVWAWAPGPPEVVPTYIPATVGWLEGGPGLGWVSLGWGEPVFPWWGPPGAAGVASWAGWGGPWVVNRAPIQQRVAIYASSMSYVNAERPGAVVATRADRFGRGAREHLRATPDDVALMRPREGGPAVSPVAASLQPSTARVPKPATSLTEQRVVATRMPPDAGTRLRDLGLKVPGTAVVQLVLPPPRTSPSTGDRPPEAAASAPVGAAEHASLGDNERARPPRAPGFVDWLNGVEAAEAAARRVPRDLFEAPWSSEAVWAWRSNRGFEPPMGEPYRTDLPGEPAMRLRPSGGTGGFAVSERERREAPPPVASAMPRAKPVSPPPVVAALTPTTSSTMVVSSTTLAPPTTLATPTTFVTPMTFVSPPPIVSSAPAPASFQSCTGVGAVCGPCAPSGAMAVCLRQIGKLNPVCSLPDTCIALKCLFDSDCGTGRHCVQNADTLQANCCDECTEVVREHMPRFVSLSSTTTSSTIVLTSTTRVAPTALVTSTTVVPSRPEPAFQRCTAVGATCGPCQPSGRMSRCLRQIGNETAICAQPDTCVAVSCLWDRDCGPGRRCVLNPATQQTNCCEQCSGLGRDDLFDVSTVSTTTTLPPEGFRRCVVVGDTCGPCAPSGLMTLCQQEIGSTHVLCPKPGSCVDVTCTRNTDCLANQHCMFNGITKRSNCCEVCEEEH